MTVAGAAVLTIAIDGVAVALIVSLSVAETAEPVGGVPEAVALLLITPASMSACVAE